MKTFQTLLLTLAMGLTMNLSVLADNDKPITVKQLPAVAQRMIQTHFGGQKVSFAKCDREVFGNEYDVIFTSGHKVEFDKNGRWTHVSCRKGSVPSKLVPAAIRSYVGRNYRGARIVEIDRERSGYEVELSNGVDLKFNKNGKLTKVDR